MHRIGTLALTAIALTATPTEAGAAPCGVGGAKVLKKTSSSLIVKERVGTRRVKVRYWGCLRATQRPVLVGWDGQSGGDTHVTAEESFAVRGRYVVAVSAWCLGECGPGTIALYDLRRGGRVYSRNARRGSDLVHVMVSRRGAIVLVDEIYKLRVWVVDARGMRLVARGSHRAMPLRHIRVRGDSVRWRFRGRARSSRLYGRPTG